MAEPKLYLRTGVARRWRQGVQAAGDFLAFSPYLTNCEMTAALAARGGRCSLYTVASVENLASGASSLACLRTLVTAGVRVYHLPGLHAKLLLVPGKLVTVGSQNFTAGGVVNREATVALKGARVARQAHAEVRDWIEGGNPVQVTNEVLAVLEAEVERLRPAYQQFDSQARQATEQVWDSEHVRQQQERQERERQEQERLEAERREAERRLEVQRRREEQERRRAEEERQRQIIHRQGRRDSQEVRYAGLIHAGTVADTAGWSLDADPDDDLLRWEAAGRTPEALTKGYWYPCHLSDRCRWGWARVYPSCISFVARSREYGNYFHVGGRRYLIRPSFVWDAPADGWNVRFTVWWAGREAVLPGRLTPTDLRVVEEHADLGEVARAINENSHRLNDDLRGFVLSPMSSHRLKWTPRADDFFGRDTRHHLRLGVVDSPHPAGGPSRMRYIESC